MDIKQIAVIGDIHGDYDWYHPKIKELNAQGIHTIQIGDFGIGFPINTKWNEFWANDPDDLSRMNSVFIGNHDNSSVAQKTPMFLPRFGYNPETDIFWVGGAYSIDKWARTEHFTWWSDEELSYGEMVECEELYRRYMPKTVLTHDGPTDIVKDMFPEYQMSGSFDTTRTGEFLQTLYDAHSPSLWLFGHHHASLEVQEDKTLFKVVGINSVEMIDV